MKLAIVGSRTFNDFDCLDKHIHNFFNISEISLIISGGAKGADTLAEKFAKKHNISTEIYKPEWDKFGKRAGFIRNREIVISCDKLVAFWDGKSRGTEHSINLAEEFKKEHFVVFFK